MLPRGVGMWCFSVCQQARFSSPFLACTGRLGPTTMFQRHGYKLLYIIGCNPKPPRPCVTAQPVRFRVSTFSSCIYNPGATGCGIERQLHALWLLFDVPVHESVAVGLTRLLLCWVCTHHGVGVHRPLKLCSPFSCHRCGRVACSQLWT